MDNLLTVNNLNVSFRMYNKALEQYDMNVISDLSLDVNAGEIVAVAGSSGSGKSLLAHAIMGLLPPNATATGNISFKGEVLDSKKQAALRGSSIALVPQSVSYLDPLMRVGAQVEGTSNKKQAQKSIFKRLGLKPDTAKLYPFQLSGGMARRTLVATAVISDADLIIADEPTPGMDPQLALEALQCFREQANEGKGVILITHDIDIAVGIADRLAVFYAGTTVELAPASDFIKGEQNLRHPYTKALWHALPQNGFKPIQGFQPYAGELPPGCLFAPRCKLKTARCETAVPPMSARRGGFVRCIHAS